MFGEAGTAAIDITFTIPGVNGLEGFDAIRDEPAFKKLAERAEKLYAST